MKKYFLHIAILSYLMMNCQPKEEWKVEIYETSAKGNKLTQIKESPAKENAIKIRLKAEEKFQKITGFWGLIYGKLGLFTQ
ncbi:MAG: hypothetical protein HC913_04920 [Microscillaceae bacterium]|nr:hypothetical protein [Microscillaceae bacterium]